MEKLKLLKLTKKQQLYLLLALLAALIVVPFVITDMYILHIIISCFIYASLALSLNLIIGFSGQFSLGHVTFYGIGAYTTALLMMKAGMSFWLAALISAVLVGIVGALLSIPTLKLRGDYLAVVTLGFGEVFRLFVLNAVDLTRGPMGLPGIPSPSIFGFVIETKTHYYYFGLIILILVIVFMRRLMTSGFGMAMLSVKEDDIAAQAIGIHPARYKLMAFTIGAVVAGIVGSFYAVYMAFISPSSFQYGESISMVAMVVLGGLGSIPGAILGAVLLTILPEALRSFSDYRLIIYGVVMILMMIFRPNGIWGIEKRRRNAYLGYIERGVRFGKNTPGA